MAPCPDMSVAKSVSVEFDTATSEIIDETVGGASSREFRNPSLVPNMGRANIGESFHGTHPLTVQVLTSLGDTASGGFPLTALGRYTEPDDLLAQDRFWTRTARRSRDVDSGSDFLIPEFDSRSGYDRYFVEIGISRDSAVASAGTQVGLSPWTLTTPGPTQGVPHPSSDPSLVPPRFKKPRTPPPRTIVATTCTEMYMRHTSQDVVVTSPPGYRRSSSSSTSTGSRILGPPQTSPLSSV